MIDNHLSTSRLWKDTNSVTHPCYYKTIQVDNTCHYVAEAVYRPVISKCFQINQTLNCIALSWETWKSLRKFFFAYRHRVAFDEVHKRRFLDFHRLPRTIVQGKNKVKKITFS